MWGTLRAEETDSTAAASATKNGRVRQTGRWHDVSVGLLSTFLEARSEKKGITTLTGLLCLSPTTGGAPTRPGPRYPPAHNSRHTRQQAQLRDCCLMTGPKPNISPSSGASTGVPRELKTGAQTEPPPRPPSLRAVAPPCGATLFTHANHARCLSASYRLN